MAAKMRVLGLILSSSPYLRSALGGRPLDKILIVKKFKFGKNSIFDKNKLGRKKQLGQNLHCAQSILVRTCQKPDEMNSG